MLIWLLMLRDWAHNFNSLLWRRLFQITFWYGLYLIFCMIVLHHYKTLFVSVPQVRRQVHKTSWEPFSDRSQRSPMRMGDLTENRDSAVVWSVSTMRKVNHSSDQSLMTCCGSP